MGLTGTGGLCKVVVTRLIESCVLYAVSLLPVIEKEATGHPMVNFFVCIFPQTQVRAFSERPFDDVRTDFLMIDDGLNRSSLHC